MSDTTAKIIAAPWALVAVALIVAKLLGLLSLAWWIVLIPITIPLAAIVIYLAWFLLFITTTDFRS